MSFLFGLVLPRIRLFLDQKSATQRPLAGSQSLGDSASPALSIRFQACESVLRICFSAFWTFSWRIIATMAAANTAVVGAPRRSHRISVSTVNIRSIPTDEYATSAATAISQKTTELRA